MRIMPMVLSAHIMQNVYFSPSSRAFQVRFMSTVLIVPLCVYVERDRIVALRLETLYLFW